LKKWILVAVLAIITAFYPFLAAVLLFPIMRAACERANVDAGSAVTSLIMLGVLLFIGTWFALFILCCPPMESGRYRSPPPLDSRPEPPASPPPPPRKSAADPYVRQVLQNGGKL